MLILIALGLLLNGASVAANESLSPHQGPNKPSNVPPQIQIQQKPDRPIEGQRDTQQQVKPSTDPSIVIPSVPTQVLGKERKNDTNKSPDESSEFTVLFGHKVKITDGLLALLTFLLVIVNFIQARATKTAAIAARDASRIARKSLEITQRAYIKMSHRQPGLVLYHPTPSTCMVDVEIQHIGQTPATVTEVNLTFKFHESLPKVPEYFPSNKQFAPYVLLYKDEFFGYSVEKEMPAEFIADIGRKDLYVYGYVDYIDQFDQRYRAGYARQYSPGSISNNLLMVIKKGYNYDRPRNQGEGHDWDSTT